MYRKTMANPKEHMYCTMCYNNFSLNSRKPKVLPCDHLVCDKCLKQVCKNVQRNFSCPECHESHPVFKYPDQKEIIKMLEEIQRRKEERKAQRRNLSLHDEKATKRKSRGNSSNDGIKEVTKEDIDVEKISAENLDELNDDEAKDLADQEQDPPCHTKNHEVQAPNKVLAAKKYVLVHSNSAPNMFSDNYSNGAKPKDRVGNHNNQPGNGRKMCSMHKKRFIMMCKDHGALICHECWKTKHDHCSTNDFWDEIDSRKQGLLDRIYRQEATLKNYKDEVERAFDTFDFKSNKTLEDIKDCREM